MNQYIITEGGIGELEMYFMEHHDDFFGIAWKNFKDKHIQPYNPQAGQEKVLDELEDFLQKLPEPASIDGIEMWNKVFKKILELRQSKEEQL